MRIGQLLLDFWYHGTGLNLLRSVVFFVIAYNFTDKRFYKFTYGKGELVKQSDTADIKITINKYLFFLINNSAT